MSAAFTQNTACAAPVEVARSHHSNAPARLLIINSGNANAGTGRQGMEDAISYCKKASELFAFKIEQVLPFSTGVIGKRLPIEKIRLGCKTIPEYIGSSPEYIENFLSSIISIVINVFIIRVSIPFLS